MEDVKTDRFVRAKSRGANMNSCCQTSTSSPPPPRASPALTLQILSGFPWNHQSLRWSAECKFSAFTGNTGVAEVLKGRWFQRAAKALDDLQRFPATRCGNQLSEFLHISSICSLTLTHTHTRLQRPKVNVLLPLYYLIYFRFNNDYDLCCLQNIYDLNAFL